MQNHISVLVGVMFKKLDDLVSNGNKDAIVSRAWEYFSKWACWMENVDCTIRAMEYFKRWEAGEKSLIIIYTLHLTIVLSNRFECYFEIIFKMIININYKLIFK